jgi:hypothetical protein
MAATASILVHGTANPCGENSQYDGLFLRRDEINNLVLERECIGLPVKVEHGTDTVGRVLSAWDYGGRLDMVLEIGGAGCNNSVDSCIAQQFVQNNVCRELSLGYSVEMQHSDQNGLHTGKKRLTEVSLVKVGARDNCLIHSFLQS